MTSRDALHAYREKTADKHPHERVYFFHAHIYYDSSSQEETSKMHALVKALQQHTSEDDHVEIHTLQVSTRLSIITKGRHAMCVCLFSI